MVVPAVLLSACASTNPTVGDRPVFYEPDKVIQIVPDVQRPGWVVCREHKSCELTITPKHVKRPGMEPLPEPAAAQEVSIGEDLAQQQAEPPVLGEFTITAAVFASGSADILDFSALESAGMHIAELIGAHRAVNLMVAGYTDSTGSSRFNAWLAEQRAKSVADWLAGRLPIEVGLTTEGRPQCCYAAENASEHGRSLNRRVTVTVMPKEVIQ